MKSQRPSLRICLVAACAVVSLAGCGSRTVAPGVTASEDGEKVTLNTPGGKTEFTTGSTNVELPDGFPDDMPLYPRAIVKVASETAGMTLVSLETSDSMKQVWDYYNKEFDDKKWQTAGTWNTSEGGQISVEKDNQVCSVTIATVKKSGRTTVTIMVGSQPKP